jgi:DNA-directed RNA polymerase specialized sigma24 family protein
VGGSNSFQNPRLTSGQGEPVSWLFSYSSNRWFNSARRSSVRAKASGVRIVAAQREALLDMRSRDEIGDDAFHQVEAQLEVAEVNALGAEYP